MLGILKNKALFEDLPEALDNSVAIAAACTFNMEEIAYQFPDEDVPAGHDAASWLRELTWRGAAQRYCGAARPTTSPSTTTTTSTSTSTPISSCPSAASSASRPTWPSPTSRPAISAPR